MSDVRKATLQEVWDAVDKHIKPGMLQGNGCDETATRNGLILASNLIVEMIHDAALASPEASEPVAIPESLLGIIKSICRLALVGQNEALVHQVDRLYSAVENVEQKRYFDNLLRGAMRGSLHELPRHRLVFSGSSTPASPPDKVTGFGFDLVAHLERQRAFSLKTFGPGSRVHGVTDHIAKELIEVRESGALEEWVDVILLALDGAWRSGAPSQVIANAIDAKQSKNERRKWPDWRTAPADKAIEHDRSEDAATPPAAEHPAQESAPASGAWVAEVKADARIEWRSVADTYAVLAGTKLYTSPPAAEAQPAALTVGASLESQVQRLMEMAEYAYACRDDIRSSSGASPRSHELRFLREAITALAAAQPAAPAQALTEDVRSTRRHEALGATIERAAAELPIGYEIHVCVERGAGWAILYNPDGDGIPLDDIDADDRLTAEIDNAISEARKAAG